MSKKKTTEEFIAQARSVHGDVYDYSTTEYVGANVKVKVICRKHGEFSVCPNVHLKHGCSKCSYEEARRPPKTTEEYLKQAKEVHGSRYDYSKVNYTNALTKITVTCRIHGDFEVLPNNHLITECGKCSVIRAGRKRMRTTEDFIIDANSVYNNFYDYSKSVYTGNHDDLVITCPKHGDFVQKASTHLQGRTGCTSCVKEKMRSYFADSKEQFVSKALLVHGDKYDYSLVDYVNNSEKVTIVCPLHGEYRQTGGAHLSGSSCPSCAKTGFDYKKQGFVYILESLFGIIKIGITNNDVSKRVTRLNRNKIDKFRAVYYKQMQGGCAKFVEGKLLSWLKQHLMQPTDKFEGHTECFNRGNITFPQIIDNLLNYEKEYHGE